MSGRSIRASATAVAASCLIVACGGTAPVAQPPAAATSATATPSAVTSPVSINATMVSIVDHAGHQLWEVEREGSTPKSKADWENVAEHAIQLAAAGALIRVAGTGVNDRTWVGSPAWQQWAREMSDAALAALKATEGENFEALVTANGRLVESCEGCHKEFKPSAPTEGIVHGHVHSER